MKLGEALLDEFCNKKYSKLWRKGLEKGIIISCWNIISENAGQK